jgi:hypothetical protein
MGKTIAKKTIILYVFKLLYNGSSWEKPLSVAQITHVLNSIGIDCTSCTIGRNINYLIDFGLPVIRKKGNKGGYFYLKEKDNFFK